MLLYHFNFGYPLLDESSRFIVPAVKTRQRDHEGYDGNDSYKTFSTPVDGKAEEVFYHQAAAGEDGFTHAILYNDKLDLGACITYDTRKLNNLVQWKSMKSGDYALGIEPANCVPEGRVKARQEGTLQTIQPYEKIRYEFEFTILEGKEELQEMESRINQLQRNA
jgi:hypothetical protein